jgi:hypothetical protein
VRELPVPTIEKCSQKFCVLLVVFHSTSFVGAAFRIEESGTALMLLWFKFDEFVTIEI